MKREEFLLLTEAEQDALLTTAEADSKLVSDLEAERDSFKSENEKLSGSVKALTEELKRVKESNYTLTRRLSIEDEKTPEEIINDLFK